MVATVSESLGVDAPQDVVYALVADLPAMGRWSPECTSAEWRGGATGPVVGARFKGRNRHGRHRWSTDGVVVAAEPGQKFAFEISTLRVPVARWSYEFTPREGGCTVTEQWADRRPAWFQPIARLATGVADRTTHNAATMRTTLQRLKAAAESAA